VLSLPGGNAVLKYFCLLLVLFSGAVHAYDFGDGVIAIPEGFEGPISQNMGQANITAYRYPHDTNTGTLLQITAWNPGQQFPQMSREELEAGSKRYLLQFLGGVQRKRDNFKQGDVEFIQISGLPVAKVEWDGAVQGTRVHGVMYCFLYNSTIYSFHTQDFSSFEGKYTKLAVDAFESIELKR
jgi:hypothetical protein